MTTKKFSSKRVVNGILLLDKPSANGLSSRKFSSNAMLQVVKRLFRAKKAGHTGSIDPFASGMLPICFGEATKFSQFLLDSDKTYHVLAKLGVRTTTSDLEGEVVDERPVPQITIKDIDRAFGPFRGAIKQVPSMYSALKIQGQPLYKLARQGITVDRPSRSITVYALDVIGFDNNVVEFKVECSKGTYVRTLVDDFGELLGCGAHAIGLRRLLVGPYPARAMVTLAQLERDRDNLTQLDQHLLPVATSVAAFPEVRVTESMAFYLHQGQSVMISEAPQFGLVRIVTKTRRFLGVGEIEKGQRLLPRRLIQL